MKSHARSRARPNGGGLLNIKEEIARALRGLRDPHTGKDLIEGGFVQDLSVTKGIVRFSMRPPAGEETCPQYVPLAVEAKKIVKAVPGVKKVEATLTCHVQERAVNEALVMMDTLDRARPKAKASGKKGGRQ